MGWNISHVSMEKSQSVLHPCSSLHVFQHAFAEVRASGRPTWSPWTGLTAGFPALMWGMESGRELGELLTPIKILLLNSQMNFEEFRADSLSLSRSSVLVGKPRPCQQAYQETASPSCIRRHPKQYIAKQMRVLFIDTSAEAKPYFQKLEQSKQVADMEILPFCHLCFDQLT